MIKPPVTISSELLPLEDIFFNHVVDEGRRFSAGIFYLFICRLSQRYGLLNLILSLFFKLIKIYTAGEICLCHLCHATQPELSEYLRPKAFFVDL